ncbi:MAG TPA: hypothetical protein VNC78_09460 [Actinomycetota bacterium]|nr:hypothetical protein [Actinomycetota bacterium]
MKKWLAVALMLLLVPSAAYAQGKKQEVSGTVVLPAPHPQDQNACFPGIQRRIAMLTMGNGNSVFGHVFDVDPKTAGKNFVLEATGGTGTIDLDIQFVQKFGTPDQVASDPTTAGAPATVDFAHRATGGESGKVPASMEKAIVCIFPGAGGVNASFTYTAGAGVKIPK